MIENKNTYLEYVRRSQEILNGQSIKPQAEKLADLQKQLEDAELIVPVVGAFSAGKSTLINSFVGDEILPVGTTPETALATELRYGDRDYYLAIKEDGNSQEYKTSQNEEIKQAAQHYKYLQLFLQNNKLRDLEPLTLVDMPGFDAPVALHNQAILNYLEKGVYFVVLIAIGDGTITRSMEREIHDIMRIGKDFTFCLAKTNLKPESEVREVQENVSEQLADYFDYNKPLVLTTKKSGGENLQDILGSIDTEQLFESLFLDLLKDAHAENEGSINTTIATLKKSKAEVESAIKQLQQGIESIRMQKQKAIAEARYSGQSMGQIIEAVGKELSENRDILVECAMSGGQDAFSREVNDIVKSVLIVEVSQFMQGIREEIFKDITLNVNSAIRGLDGFELGPDFADKVKTGLENAAKAAQRGLTSLQTKLKSTNKTGSVLSRLVGVGTSIIMPDTWRNCDIFTRNY